MNKIFCKHSNCKYYYNLNANGFCEFHQEELDNNGKPGHVTCSWCTEYKKNKVKGNCESCDKETKEAYEMEDGSYVCLSCYTDAISRLEYALESAKEDPYFWDSRESI